MGADRVRRNRVGPRSTVDASGQTSAASNHKHRVVLCRCRRDRREPANSLPVTRVYTDAGVTGTSFLGCPRDVLERWVKPTLVGEDVFAIDRHLKRLQMERGESGVQTWSGVEHALWDAVGRACNQPVAKLLGGFRDRLRVYRTSFFPESRTSRMFRTSVRLSSPSG